MDPSNYIIPWKIGNETITLLLNVYVDDLTLCGDQVIKDVTQNSGHSLGNP